MRTRSASQRVTNVPKNRAYVEIIVSAPGYRVHPKSQYPPIGSSLPPRGVSTRKQTCATTHNKQSTHMPSEQTFTSGGSHIPYQSATVSLKSSLPDSSFLMLGSDPSEQESRPTASDSMTNSTDVTMFSIDAAEIPTRVVVHPSDLWPFDSDTPSDVVMSASPSRGAGRSPSTPTKARLATVPFGTERNPHPVPPFLSWQRTTSVGPPRNQPPKLEAPKFSIPAHLIVTPGRNDTDAQRRRELEIHEEQMRKLFEMKRQAEARLAEIEIPLSDPFLDSVDSAQVNIGTLAANVGQISHSAGSVGMQRKPPKLGPCETELISENGDVAERTEFIGTVRFPEVWVKAAMGLTRQDTEPI